MAWIESHQTLGRHPKTRKAARMLHISVPTMIGHMHLLWWWALDYAQEGDLSAFEHADIADAAMWEGDADEFVAALEECAIGAGYGFLEPGYKIHDWQEHAGKLIDKRRADAERKRVARRPEDIATPIEPVLRTSYGHPTDGAGTVQYSTVPNSTEQTRGEETSPAPTPARQAVVSPPAQAKPEIHPVPKPKAQSSKPQSAATPIPANYAPTLVMLAAAREKYPGLDLEDATEEWATSMRSNTAKYRYTDWDAAWWNAMKRAAKWAADRGGQTNGHKPTGQSNSRFAVAARNHEELGRIMGARSDTPDNPRLLRPGPTRT